MNLDSKNALIETRDMLRDLSGYLVAVHNQNGTDADPVLMCFSSQLETVACNIETCVVPVAVQEATA